MHESDLSQEAIEASEKIAELLGKSLKNSKFIKNFFEDLYDEFQSNLETYVENDQLYNYRLRIAREVTYIINSLLIGDKKAIKSLLLDTEYMFGKLPEIRLKIWEACSSEIEKSIITKQKKEIIELKNRIKDYETYR